MAKRKSGVGALVASQAMAKSNATTKVVDLAQRRREQPHVEHGNDPATGSSFLRAVFPSEGGGSVAVVDLCFLLRFPELAVPLAEGFLRWAAGKAPATRAGIPALLSSSTGFVAFLTERFPAGLRLDSLDRALFTAFVKWLDGSGLHPTSRRKQLGAIRNVLTHLAKGGEWSKAGRDAVRSIPKRSWPGSAKKATPRERLDREHLAAIIEVAEAEVLGLAERWAAGQSLLIDGRAKLAAGKRDLKDLATVVAVVDRMYPGLVPSMDEIRTVDSELANVLQHRHRMRNVVSCFYPSARDLVPLVVLLAFATAFNPETLLNLTWDDVIAIDRLGGTAVRLVGRKGRASKDQVVTLDAGSRGNGIGVRFLLDLLAEMTVRARPSLGEGEGRKRLFVYVPKGGGSAGTFAEGAGVRKNTVWQDSLRLFTKDNGLALFTLAQIRTTLQDEVHRLTGDILAARAIGQQRHVKTVWTHYTSDGTKALYRERVGEVLMLRERWLDTRGVIDPRARTVGQDKGAATPGFLCLDPFDSPRPTQTKGRLCTAYGECVSCPMAAATLGDVASVAAYLGLRRAIYAAQGRIAPKSWTSRWAPVLETLEGLLTQVPPEVMAKAELINLHLPPVG